MKLGLAIFLVLWAAVGPLGAQAKADLVLINGRIFTSDPLQPTAAAIAIRGTRILAVGSNKEIRKLASTKTRIVDLKGATVVPGFNDAHAHFAPIFGGVDLEFDTHEPTWPQTLATIESGVGSAPSGKWIFGTVGETVINDPDAGRDGLDRVAPDNPVLLSTYFGHGAIVNSRALEALQIAENVTEPKGGRFERDHRRRLTGKLFEYAVWNLYRVLSERETDEQLIADLQGRAQEAASYGITSMQIMPGISTERFVTLLNNAKLPIRVRAIAFSTTTPKSRDLRDIRSLARLRSASANVTASGIKWILDGTPLERGAAMRAPYLDRPDHRGTLNFNPLEVEKIVRESLDLKQPLLVHAVGDRAVETLFDAMEKVGKQRKVDWPSKRVRVEHGEGVSAELVLRAKQLGVVVVQNPSHFTVVNETNARWGKNSKFGLQRSLIDRRIKYALGSDGPVNPFLNIMFAVIDPARPDQAITRDQAVRAYTTGSAYAEFAEDQKGMLKSGMLADLAVLSQDIFSVPANALPGTTSVLTIVGGRIVHDKKTIK
jgi:predicted amidohydrolase YtcJ